ncbi:MAG: phosphatase PAP2 family protein [Firmicutes bacterium]|nr:phosphatase PAP2 family protein [Bacillota bacterium]
MQGQLAWLYAIQSIHTPALDSFFRMVTQLGDPTFYTAVLLILFWCVSPALTLRLVTVFLFSIESNIWIKETVQEPRPLDFPGILSIGKATGYAFPSGHAQGNITFWGFLWYLTRRRWVLVVGIVLTLLVSFSRLYLGVHWPWDVIGGILIGGCFVVLGALALRYWPIVRQWGWKKHGIWAVITIGAAVAHRSHDSLFYMGILLALGEAYWAERRTTHFVASGKPWQYVGRVLLGVAGIVILYVGLYPLLPDSPFVPFLEGLLLGAWGAGGAPWLFVRLRLAESGERGGAVRDR